MAKARSWEVSDEFWLRVEPLIPKRMRRDGGAHRRRPGGGRKPMDSRKVFEGVVFVLRTGCQWKALPKERLGSASSVHKCFRQWLRAGFFLNLWRADLCEHDEMEGIAWKWQSVDGSMVKAPLAQEAVGPNPTDREKNGSKRHLLVDGLGVPPSLIATGANRHDVSQLAAVVDAAALVQPGQNKPCLYADKGYDGQPAQDEIASHG